MVDPPLAAGAVKLTMAEALAAVAETPVGAPGSWPRASPGSTRVEAGPVPMPLVALTVKV